MNIIKIENLNFSYDEGKNILDNVNLKINQGDFVSIIGHNGSGKSTLSKILNLLYTPNDGNIFICGFNIKDLKDPWSLRQNVGMVFQNPDNQIVATSVEEDIAFGLENIGIESSKMQEIIDQTLEMVNMKKFAKSQPYSLSGGQKQRIAIAGILAMRPKVIIFDESTSMLDPKGRRDILNFVKKINKEENITVIWITHYIEETVDSDKIFVFNKGKIYKYGTPIEVYNDINDLRAIGLDVPKTIELSKFLIENGVPLKNIMLNEDLIIEELIKLCRY